LYKPSDVAEVFPLAEVELAVPVPVTAPMLLAVVDVVDPAAVKLLGSTPIAVDVAFPLVALAVAEAVPLIAPIVPVLVPLVEPASNVELWIPWAVAVTEPLAVLLTEAVAAPVTVPMVPVPPVPEYTPRSRPVLLAYVAAGPVAVEVAVPDRLPMVPVPVPCPAVMSPNRPLAAACVMPVAVPAPVTVPMVPLALPLLPAVRLRPTMPLADAYVAVLVAVAVPDRLPTVFVVPKAFTVTSSKPCAVA